MAAVFLSNLELKENEGIYKKILSQATALSKIFSGCYLVTREGEKAKVFDCLNEEIVSTNANVLEFVEKIIESRNIKLVYIRHMIPSFKLIKLLNYLNKKGVRVYYEIPTYPYFAEQYRTSKKKYRAIAKITLDIIFMPIIYRKVEKIIVIKSNTKTKIYPKMVEINNGIQPSGIREKDYNFPVDYQCEDHFRMVAVGTLYPYHGYDRILKGMKNCNELVDSTVVEFHIIGESPTIDDLKRESEELGLKSVYFHGIKTTAELNEMYDNFDVGLGCLALHRRNADIDTTLKIIEYYCRGIPVVTSGISPIDNILPCTIRVEDSEEPISILDIYKSYKAITMQTKRQISECARKEFSWDNIFANIFND